MVMLVGLKDDSEVYTQDDIEQTLSRLGLLWNYIYQRMRGRLPSGVYVEYFPSINVLMVYGYPETFERVITCAVEDIRKELPRYKPKFVGFGDENIHDGEQMTVEKTGYKLDEEVEKIIKSLK